MAEGYRFREIRKNERDDVLMFAGACGLIAELSRLHHNLSLVVNDAEEQIVAAALCLDDEEGRLVIEVVTSEDPLDQGLANELADRCLRKVQSESFGAARLHSPKSEPADSILLSSNWLDQIQETPPQVDAAAGYIDTADPSQAV